MHSGLHTMSGIFERWLLPTEVWLCDGCLLCDHSRDTVGLRHDWVV